MPTVSIYSVLTFWDADCPSPKLIHCLVGIEVDLWASAYSRTCFRADRRFLIASILVRGSEMLI